MSGCRVPTQAFKAKLIVRDKSKDSADKIVWKWVRGQATAAADFGDPLASDAYTLCLWSVAGTPSLIARVDAPAGGTCAGKACWRSTGRSGITGYKYVDSELTPNGAQKVVLASGPAGKAKAIVKAKHLPHAALVAADATRAGAVAGGGRLLRDLPRRDRRDEMGTAKLLSARNCFRNYRAMVNPGDEEYASIFSNLPFLPNYGGLTFSGCGHLSPLQNDPELVSVGVGTGLLFNGNDGYVFSAGTRSRPKYPNLMTAADMKGMDPTLMGGYRTGEGPEVLTTYAIPIPILNDAILRTVMTKDEDIPLSGADVRDRHKIGQTNYGDAWTGHDEIITVDTLYSHRNYVANP